MSAERLIMVVREIVGFTDGSSDEWMEVAARLDGRWQRVLRRWGSKHRPLLCHYCGEPVPEPEPEPTIVFIREHGVTREAQHRECSMRSVIGGYNHLRGTCSCCGGSDPPDPPEMTKREAALAAVRYWRLR